MVRCERPVRTSGHARFSTDKQVSFTVLYEWGHDFMSSLHTTIYARKMVSLGSQNHIYT